MNPFDPKDDEYFAQRKRGRMLRRLEERAHLKRVWLKQNGQCPVCGEVFDSGSGWHVHHKLKQSDGGPNTVANLVMLHPNCHQQVHNPHVIARLENLTVAGSR